MTPASARQNVRLESGETLALDLRPPADPAQPWFLYLHGLGSTRNGEKARYFEQELTARGFGFARFDFRGHGDSGGRMASLTLTRQLDDVRAIVAHLAAGMDRAAPPRELIPIGSSLGGLTAAWFTARDGAVGRSPLPIGRQILIAPAFRILERYLAALGDFGRQRWEREGTFRFVGPWFEFDLEWAAIVDGRNYPPEELLETTALPTLLLHGTADRSAPFSLSVEFAAGCRRVKPELVAIEGGDHRLTAQKSELLDAIVRFVDATAG